MKGVIFNAIEKVVIELFDEDTWDQLIEDAGVSGSYTALGTYPDQEVFAIVGAACKLTGMTSEEVLVTVGRKALPHLASHIDYPINHDSNVFQFLGEVHDIIHVEVKKLYPDAETPAILVEPIDENTAQVVYQSKRNLPALAKGLILGAGDLCSQELDVITLDSDEKATTFKVGVVNKAEIKEPAHS